MLTFAWSEAGIPCSREIPVVAVARQQESDKKSAPAVHFSIQSFSILFASFYQWYMSTASAQYFPAMFVSRFDLTF